MKNPRNLILVFVCLLVLVGLAFYGISQINNSVGNLPNTLLVPTPILSPTPYPFQEHTIPYLQKRSFLSKLNEKTLYANNGAYTSYLTSYTSDTLIINGLLTIPKQEPPKDGFPAIIFIHGYIPPSVYKTTEKYIEYVDSLARSGFVVFKIDLRGHGSSEGEPSGAYFSSDYVIDALNAYAALQTDETVNKNKIGLWGHSMAGNIVMRSLAVKPEIPAAVIWAGAVYSYVDQQKYGLNDNSYQPPPDTTRRVQQRQRIRDLYGNPDNTTTFWKEMAPTNFVSEMKGAIEIHHSVDDTVVNIGYSRDLMTLLDTTTVSHKLYEYPTGGHNITGSSFTTAMNRTIEFFKKNL